MGIFIPIVATSDFLAINIIGGRLVAIHSAAEIEDDDGKEKDTHTRVSNSLVNSFPRDKEGRN